jgi:hypothetical protein
MADKRIVKGLLDIVDAEAAGEEWDFQPGWEGLTEAELSRFKAEAELSRFKSVLKDIFAEYDLKPKPRPGGRPRKAFKGNEAKAYACWVMVWNIRAAIGKPSAKVEILEIIGAIKFVEQQLGVPERERTFYKGNDSSRARAVTRGKAKLGIDRDWNSAECEKIRDHKSACA